MSIILGDVENIALEYVESKSDKRFGRFFLHIHSTRFGEDDFDYEVKPIINNILVYFQLDGINFPELFKCPAKELFSSYNLAWIKNIGVDETVDAKNIACEANKYMPNFMENYANSDDLDHCVFRYAHYAFDNCIIITIPSGNQIRIYAKDENSGVYSDAVISINEFIQMWKSLKDQINFKP